MYKDLQDFINSFLLKDPETGQYFRGRIQTGFLSKNHPEMYRAVLENSKFLPESAILPERLYCIINSIIEKPRCPCGKEVKFGKQERKYRTYCSINCEFATSNLQINSKKYCKEVLGVDHIFQSSEMRSRRDKTWQDKYGGHPTKNKEVQDKKNKTMNERFGGNAPMCSEAIKEKTKSTLKSRYNVESVFNLPKVREKSLKNFREFGLDKMKEAWHSKSSEEMDIIVQKREVTNQDRYGFKYYSATPESINIAKAREAAKLADGTKHIELAKAARTNSIKFNRPNYNQRHLPDKTFNLRTNEVRYTKFLTYCNHVRNYSLEKIADIVGMDITSISNDFKKYNITLKSSYPISKGHREVLNFIKSIIPDQVVVNDRSSLSNTELDIYIPTKNLAIEYNGIYFHSYKYLPSIEVRKKHFLKTSECRSLGINLFQIGELDWTCPIRNQIWKSLLKSKLGLFDSVLNGRSTKIIQVSRKEADRFYNSNHLQGAGVYSVNYGLVQDNELVSCMSFKQISKGIWELNRFSNRINTSVRGAASKLLKKFKDNNIWTKIITFADLRYSYGGLYKVLGFELDHEVDYSYYYTDRRTIFYKSNFRKVKLKKLMGDSYSDSKTEFELVLGGPRYRILFDAGKLRFKIENTSTTL